MNKLNISLANMIIHCYQDDLITPLVYLQKELNDKQLNKTLKASKQLVNLCLQEIRRRDNVIPTNEL